MNAGRKPGPGRPPGVPNKAAGEVRGLAQLYGPAAIRAFAVLGGLVAEEDLLPGEKVAENETNRVRCIENLVDRAYGKAAQPMEHSVTEGFENLLERIVKR